MPTAGLIERFAGCFSDARETGSVEHSVEDLLRQRTYCLALGYEDLTDHDELRIDALLASVVGKSTLNRLEWGVADEEIHRDRVFPDLPGRDEIAPVFQHQMGIAAVQQHLAQGHALVKERNLEIAVLQ